MTLRRRWLTPFRLGAAVVLLVLGALGWKLVVYAATYGALRRAPQGQAAGPATAPVTIIEFMDYRCAPCRALAPVMEATATAHPEVRIVYRAVPTHGKESVTEALYALAAGKQGRFAQMHALLLAHEAPVQPAELTGLCQQAQVDCAQLQADMKSTELMAELGNTYRATRMLGIRRVPTFLINRTVYDASHALPTAESLDRAIAAAKP